MNNNVLKFLVYVILLLFFFNIAYAKEVINNDNKITKFEVPDYLKNIKTTSEILFVIQKRYQNDSEFIVNHLKLRLLMLINYPKNFDLKYEEMKCNFNENDVSFKKIIINMYDAIFDNLRIDTATIEVNNISFNILSLFTDEKIKVNSHGEVYTNVCILEKDLNKFLVEKAEKIKVNKPYVKFNDKTISLGGVFKYGLFIIKFDTTGSFKIVDDSKIYFDIKQLSINSVKMSKGFVKKVLSQINPVMDLQKFPFKLVIKRITVQNKCLILSSIGE